MIQSATNMAIAELIRPNWDNPEITDPRKINLGTYRLQKMVPTLDLLVKGWNPNHKLQPYMDPAIGATFLLEPGVVGRVKSGLFLWIHQTEGQDLGLIASAHFPQSVDEVTGLTVDHLRQYNSEQFDFMRRALIKGKQISHYEYYERMKPFFLLERPDSE